MSSTALRVKELLREKGWTTKILAEKTGMSESYLTHIKNGTRRWNEDSLRKLANAFEVSPMDLFAQRRKRTDDIDNNVSMPEKSDIQLKVHIVPVVGDIPSNPSPYNNQLMQLTTGFKDVFVPVLNTNDASMFALSLSSNQLSPIFDKGDLLVISPEVWTRSGDVAAVEYGNETPIKAIAQVTYTDDFIVLESVNHKTAPIALVRGKDHFRIIGRVIARHQHFE
ncbi:XRE family transcriptional regulator [Candidatus Babela massiliensis]|uniref:Predicted transcriptional regulator n=1 Tax=Candidatus Babela massiliensis TaxID=673862 RepID=V6DGD3_9BACT|nr:XRE family transcriptional regulator [Candidatus Babela massiliensis]CDK30662.1 Predicted transcriptional regulator [Candidatus Babela massiliensis]